MFQNSFCSLPKIQQAKTKTVQSRLFDTQMRLLQSAAQKINSSQLDKSRGRLGTEPQHNKHFCAEVKIPKCD